MKTDAEYLEELTEIQQNFKRSSWANCIRFSHNELKQWIIDKTQCLEPKNIMESIYIICYNIEIKPMCECGKNINFFNYGNGYKLYCSNKCCVSSKIRKEKYNQTISNFDKNKKDSIKKKYKKTCLKRYGKEYASQTEEFKQKKNETEIEKYGERFVPGSDIWKKRSIELYGIESTNNLSEKKDKFKQTCNNRYGVDSPQQANHIRLKSIDTLMRKYGVTHSMKTPEIKKKVLNTKIKNGIVVDPLLKLDWEIYKEASKFKGEFSNFIITEEDKKLIEHYGIFKSFGYDENIDGLVRDHMFSRKHGFENKIFPEIIRHPANCEIILHRENSSKSSDSSISLIELFDKIRNYKIEWSEHDLVLSLIKDYEFENRWSNPYKSKEISDST